MFCDSLCKIPYDARIGIEQVITGHAWFTGDTSGDKDDISSFKRFFQSISLGLGSVPGYLQSVMES